MTNFRSENFCQIVYKTIENGICTHCRLISGPFERGQAIAHGTLIRRISLTLSGPYISCVTVRSSLKNLVNIVGVRESINEILANLQKIVIADSGTTNILTGQNDNFSHTYQTMNVSFTGPGIFKAKHIKLEDPFSIVNPSQYIATLEMNATLDMVLCIQANTYNTIPSNEYAPDQTYPLQNNNKVVTNFNFSINSFEKSDTESLLLEVWTNGGIAPDRAIRLSASIACSVYTGFLTIKETQIIDEKNSGGRIRTSE